MTTSIETQPQPTKTDDKPLQRQFVNFMFFKADRALRKESAEFKKEAKGEFAEIIHRYDAPIMVLPYSTLGLKSTVDFMLWRISFEIEPLQQMASAINKSILGRYLDVPHSYLAMTKHSQYVQEHVHEGQEGRRLHVGIIRDDLQPEHLRRPSLSRHTPVHVTLRLLDGVPNLRRHRMWAVLRERFRVPVSCAYGGVAE